MITKIIILGAGPCGLGAAYRLHKLGHSDWRVFERNDHTGGLSASFVDEYGFTWDVGGHVLFSHYDYFDKAVEESLGDAYYEHLRESWVRILNTWVPYPFQNNIRHLPAAALAECMDGLRTLARGGNALNFLEWMHATFGSGIVKYFMEPYNRKVWGVPLESVSKAWIGERVSVVDLKRIENNIAEARDDVNWGPNNKFKFPRTGGTGAIFNGIARLFQRQVLFDCTFTRVNLQKRKIEFADGRQEHYDSLITTTPLDLFIRSCTDIPDLVQAASQQLVHNSGLIVGLGIEGYRKDPKCWMYFPEDNCSFYRVTNFHNYSPWNVPQGDTKKYFSLMSETTYSPHKQVDRVGIVEETIRGLVNTGLMSEGERKKIVSRYVIDIPYSYPVPTIGRDEALAVIHQFLESHGVYSRGRFGAWKYEVGNMDHSFMQGVEVVDRILGGKSEGVFSGTEK